MKIEIKVPSPGESITEVQLMTWLVKDGDRVEKDHELAEIDSDKATFTVNASDDGLVTLLVAEGETIAVGSIICTIDSSAKQKPDEATVEINQVVPNPQKNKQEDDVLPKATENIPHIHVSPLAKKIMDEKHVSEDEVLQNLRIGKKEVLMATAEKKPENKPPVSKIEIVSGSRETERRQMSQLRLKLSKRLVAVKNETAMLTTFNEVNMSAILEIKKAVGERFKQKYGSSLGLVSFFAKAVTMALAEYPQVNSMIDGDEMVYHKFIDVGIAVSAPKGLVVPVIRNSEAMSVLEIELKIKQLASKARENKLTLEEMSGGTFTITNGGVFGSLLSTPILNPPQSAILGMHTIQQRPIALNNQIVIAPMMYIALSYDHRVIDGRESVSFLIKVKELLENPALLFDGNSPETVLLGN
ncbi:MAG TPA: 2-oxoglutarate dehydrogenase complex dihydrolipoyllysine-residue succinyltransferase [Bacteroidales bacterium]|nr:2-oxoglutarate dehydrogenase complex dihydrolipoyllysine-residue succinyltransferase [Bacteroidales bacterium]